MKKSLSCFAVATILLFATPARLAAQAPERPAPEARTPAPPGQDKCDEKATKEDSSVTEHSIKIGGQTIPYKATASTTLLKNDKGEPTGLLYSAAYTRSDVKELPTPPVAFLYNGGRG